MTSKTISIFTGEIIAASKIEPIYEILVLFVLFRPHQTPNLDSKTRVYRGLRYFSRFCLKHSLKHSAGSRQSCLNMRRILKSTKALVFCRNNDNNKKMEISFYNN